MKIGLLVGGDSPERDVSLSSGKAIHKALELLGNNVIVLDTFNGIRSLESKILNVDLIFNGLHGGDGENGYVAAYLESLNIPFTGSDQDSSKICMDKDLSKKLVSDKGIGTPNWIASSSLPSESQLESLGLPIIVKPNDQGSTIGLSLVKDKIEIGSAFKIASNFADSVMFESFILGREITVPIIGSNSYSIVEIVPKKNLYDYECKYTAGMSEYFCPADIDDNLSNKIKNIALRIHNLLRCRHYSRVDFLLDKNNKIWFLEINTLPGMTKTSLLPKSLSADGFSFNDVIQMIIDEALKN